MNYTEEALSWFVTYAVSLPKHRQLTAEIYLRLTDCPVLLTHERIFETTLPLWEVDVCLN